MSLCGALPSQPGGLALTPHSARSGPLLPGGLHPDDYLGQGQAPQLPEGVPRLPAPAHAHYPLPALSRPPRPRRPGPAGLHPLPPAVLYPLPPVPSYGCPAATIKPVYPAGFVFCRGAGTTPLLPSPETAQMKFRQVTQSFYFTDRSTGWRGALQGHLRAHLSFSLALGYPGLLQFPPLLPLEQSPLTFKLLHALHIAVGRTERVSVP